MKGVFYKRNIGSRFHTIHANDGEWGEIYYKVIKTARKLNAWKQLDYLYKHFLGNSKNFRTLPGSRHLKDSQSLLEVTMKIRILYYF